MSGVDTVRPGRLVLADGTEFQGQVFGAEGVAVGEAVFTTGMTGYQEVLTDPSYCEQVVVMTSPHIGNTGVNADDNEAQKPWLRAFAVHELAAVTSNWRSQSSVDEFLRASGVVGLQGVDTRALTRHLRDHGAQMCAVGAESASTLREYALQATPMTGRNLAREVTTSKAYEWREGLGTWSLDRTVEGTKGARGQSHHVVAVDYGIKRGILRCLVDAGCRVTVVPSTMTAEEILSLGPDGVFLSNGPGDPSAVREGIETVRGLLGKKPLFGICLGHQILSLALGGTSYKLKFGHRGLNQPVLDRTTGRVEITTQNHGFVVDVGSLEGKCETTHVHLNDGTCEGIEHRESGAFSVQYHPEASAGPHDSRYLFDRFVQRIEGVR
jgi:carbamoyl-phosphate synthase small subunit